MNKSKSLEYIGGIVHVKADKLFQIIMFDFKNSLMDWHMSLDYSIGFVHVFIEAIVRQTNYCK